jgi:hypothetical protein
MPSISNLKTQVSDSVLTSSNLQGCVQQSIQHLLLDPQTALHAQANLNLSDVLKLLRY